MPLLKNIPNLFTLLNLIFGCIAIVFILQTMEGIVTLDASGAAEVNLPEKLWQGSIFIFAAAFIDFLDGFIARFFKATSKMGEQLDSLSDMVSFGVAPGMILYQLLRMSFAQNENGLDVSFIALLAAFIFTAAVAWRLAKFNISTDQTTSFKGVPSPAAGLFVASLPLMMMNELKANQIVVSKYLINQWVLYALILLLSYLMVSNKTFMALKFKSFSYKNNIAKFILLALAVVIIIVFALAKRIWFAWPVIFILYVIFSLFTKENVFIETSNKQTLDVTV